MLIKEVEIKITAQVDDSMPLHGIQDDGKLLVDRPHIFLSLMNKEESKKTYRKVPKKTTAGEVKDMVVELFCKDINITDRDGSRISRWRGRQPSLEGAPTSNTGTFR